MNPPHTVVYTHGSGRLGNQMIRFLHWMAWVEAHDGQVEVLNLAFWPYARFFATWGDFPGCRFPLRASAADRLAGRYRALPDGVRRRAENHDMLPRLVHAVGRSRPGAQGIAVKPGTQDGIDLDDPAFFAQVARRAVTMCSGWKIAGWELVARHEAGLRRYFAPAPGMARPAQEFMSRLRAQHDVIIGVLIRHSDYRVWDGGRFFFSTEQYATWIRQLLDLHGGRRVAVVVASEDWQDPAVFAGLPVHLASGNPRAGGHWFENWVELSLCDFVVSAPSTFSTTAAFVGGIPVWPVVAADQVMNHRQLIHGGVAGAARHSEFSRSVK